MLPSVLDASLSRRAVMLILACLRTCGTLKVLTEVPRKERYVIDLYTKLGSYPAQLHHCHQVNNTVFIIARFHASDREPGFGAG